MHGRNRGLGVFCAILSAFLLNTAGCSWHKTCQGWLLESGWSLEFQRIPFCPRTTECCPDCGVPASCGHDCPPCGERPCAYNEERVFSPVEGESAARLPVESQVVENECNRPLWCKIFGRPCRMEASSSGGRAKCSKEAKESVAPPAANPRVIARFHPVPTQPVFSPRPSDVKATSLQDDSEPNAPEPEEIPAPPPSVPVNKSASSPRQLDVPAEPPSWIFSSPPEHQRSDSLTDAPSPSRSAERTARR
jgi:hypothetical protein